MKKHLQTMQIVLLTGVLLLSLFLPSHPLQAAAETDTTPPTLESSKLSSTEYQIGDTLKISAKVNDDFSGVNTVRAYFDSPNQNRTLNLTLKLNPETSLYEASYTFLSTDEGGTWTFDYIAMTDHASNIKLVYARDLESTLNFSLNNSVGDGLPPSLGAVALNNTDLKVGEQLEITVTATDTQSGVKSGSIEYKSPSGHRTLRIDLKLDEQTGELKGLYTVQPFDEAGKWSMYFVVLRDQAGNIELYYQRNLPTDHGFAIENSSGDGTPPSHGSLTFSPSSVKMGDVMRLQADVVDNLSGVKKVTAYVDSPSKDKALSLSLQLNKETQKYEATYRITNQDELGKWQLDYIALTDIAGNIELYYQRDMTEEVSFQVIESSSDIDNASINPPEHPYASVLKDEAFQYRTFDKTLYVGPEATLYLGEGVEVLGDVYVYGNLILQDDVKIHGTLTARSITYSSNIQTAKGSVSILSGRYKIGGTVATNGFYQVPFELEPLETTNASRNVSVSGTTLPFLEVLDGNKSVVKESNGAFQHTLENITSKKVELIAKDPFGKTKSFTTNVEDVIPPPPVSHFQITKRTSSTLELKWATSADLDVKHYEVYVDDSYYKTVTTNQIQFDQLKSNTLYDIQVVAVDSSNNKSESSSFEGLTGPEKPSVHPITDQDQKLTGTTFPSATITVYSGDIQLATTKANTTNSFTISIPRQAEGTMLSVIATNEDGYESDAAEVTVTDGTPPAAPVTSIIHDQMTHIEGSAEANAIVVVLDKNKQELTRDVADEYGNFSIEVGTLHQADIFFLQALDAAGNASTHTELVIQDGTAPIVTVETRVTSQSVRIVGYSEPNIEIELWHDEKFITYDRTDDRGYFELPVDSLSEGMMVTIRAWDMTGNYSNPIELLVEPGGYIDLPTTHWAHNSVMYLADGLIISGYPNGTFQPKRVTTRAEVARMLASALNLPEAETTSLYNDVTPTHWANKYIAAVTEKSIFSGDPSGNFRPSDPISRAEIAVVLAKAFDLTANRPAPFADISSKHWANSSIAAIYEQQITIGYQDGTYRPSASATRAEFSMFLAKALRTKN